MSRSRAGSRYEERLARAEILTWGPTPEIDPAGPHRFSTLPVRASPDLHAKCVIRQVRDGARDPEKVSLSVLRVLRAQPTD